MLLLTILLVFLYLTGMLLSVFITSLVNEGISKQQIKKEVFERRISIIFWPIAVLIVTALAINDTIQAKRKTLN